VQAVDDAHRRFSTNVRRIARDRLLPISHLADRCGISRSFLSAVLRGDKSPTLRTISRIADTLGCDIGELFIAPRRVLHN
jgi:transcriptional regulator with XRE-family HTH domain